MCGDIAIISAYYDNSISFYKIDSQLLLFLKNPWSSLIYIVAELKLTKFYNNSCEIERMTQRKEISLRNVTPFKEHKRRKLNQFPVTAETHVTMCDL